MARVTFSGIVSDVKGSIGGITFQNNSSGAIVRGRPRTRKAQSQKQQLSQAEHIEKLRTFQLLSLGSKTLWNEYAQVWTKVNSFGQVKRLTGQNWYESVNHNLELAGNPIVDIPPSHILPPAVGSYVFSMTATQMLINFNASFTPANSILLIRASSFFSLTGKVKLNSLRLIKVLDTAPYSLIDITTLWEDYFGVSYPPAANFNNFSVSIMLQTVEKTSGLASAGLNYIAAIRQPITGIGVFMIGSTFIIG